MNLQQQRQTQQKFFQRQNLAQPTRNMQSQSYTITQGYQIKTMKNEIPLPITYSNMKLKVNILIVHKK